MTQLDPIGASPTTDSEPRMAQLSAIEWEPLLAQLTIQLSDR